MNTITDTEENTMAENILIISTSLRSGSNSETLANEVLKGASDAGNNAELVSMKDKQIAFCKGCLACQKTGKCVIKDDANEITEKMKNADVIVFATPVYYYGMSGQMKTLLDRANSLYISDYKFRRIFLVTASAEAEKETAEKTIIGLKGWIECYPKCVYAGEFLGGGFNDPNEIKGNAGTMKEAYEFGKGLC